MNKLLVAATFAAFTHMPLVVAQSSADTNTQNSTATSEGDAQQLPTVVVTGTSETSYTVKDSAASTKLPMSLRETPQSVTIITRERMEDQKLTSIRDVLDNTNGVYTYSWDTERVLFTSRGFIIDNLMYDGVQTAMSADTSSIDDTLDTALYDRIEIVRGATGLMTGAGSPSASVNLVRKHADSKTFEGEAGLSAGMWNNYRGDVDLSLPLTQDGSVRARVVGAYQYNQSYQDLYRRRKPVFYAIVDADITPKTLLSVGYDFQETRARGNTWGSFPMFFSDGTRTDWARSVTTAADWTFWNKRTQSVFAELKHDFDNGWALRSTITHRWKDGEYKLLYFGGFPDRVTGLGLDLGPDYDQDPGGNPDVISASYFGHETDRLNVLDVYASGPFNLFGRKHELVAGISGSRLTQAGRNLNNVDGGMATPGNFYNWDGSYPEPQYNENPDDIDFTSAVTTQRSAYTAVRLSLADPLKLIAGVRYTNWKSEGSATEGASYGAHPFVPYAGLVGDVGMGFSVFGSYTEIFNPQGNRDVSGKYLDPIDGRSVEAGIKGTHLNGRLNTSLTIFDTRQNNVAVPDLDSNGDPIPVIGYPNQQASIAIDGTRTRGFEVEVAGELARRWNLSLGWSYYNLRDADGNAVNPHIPRTLVRLFTTWSPAGEWSRLTIGGGANWQGSSYVDSLAHPATAPSGHVDQQGALLVNLMTRYQFTPSLSLQLNGSNLLDRKYYILDNYDNSSYGAPANVSASLNFRF
ncbi:TonB-dependent siderophore receptor [Stenotrophobium rhamnosiphilum]|uniref:TonB-dependent siderophore receptor n=1 Tax=Stenotrophobium rhamnosiphilum TaxID=2029166 RepID=A0A2T5MEA3_9GAMM|nr:TonB-dependent siderophore receptor [Stenotrophobium rhamnosiphilum]PTU30908.1 TonB-dependent siderophore receptor [Stenotrophobium rhamnosiphilum]